jgi:hypothetical protein
VSPYFYIIWSRSSVHAQAPCYANLYFIIFIEISGQLQIENGKALGGLPFDSWYDRRISLSKDVKLSYPVEIVGSVQSLENIDTKRINQLDLSYLQNGILRSDKKEQVFLEAFETSGLVRVENGRLEFEREVSGFNINNIIRSALPLSSTTTEVIHSSWHFKVTNTIHLLLLQLT